MTLNFLIFIYFVYLLSSKPYRTVIVQNSAFDWLGFVRFTVAERQKGTVLRSTVKTVLSLMRDVKNLKLSHFAVFDKKQDRLLFSK